MQQLKDYGIKKEGCSTGDNAGVQRLQEPQLHHGEKPPQ
jgi:hypothetical protein